METLLKGDNFLNRYRITGTLKTLSPLHIGTGEESEDLYGEDERKRLMKRVGKLPAVSTVMRDHRGKPLIPGSSLRGVLRHWLLDVLRGVGSRWAETRDYAASALVDLEQDAQIDKVRSEFSRLELLFGTPFNAGKIEVWDAICSTPELKAQDSPASGLLHWNPKTLTYIDTSVAIDPATGTALDKLLYKTEVVPPGVEFEFNAVGQNLSDEELGIFLLALQGFNSAIYPIRLGARGGRGYGRVAFRLGAIQHLDQAGLGEWLKHSMEAIGYDEQDRGDGVEQEAGYFGLPQLDQEQRDKLIANVKQTLCAGLGR